MTRPTTPLTHTLLRERVSTLFDRLLSSMNPDEPVEEVAWEIVRCDRCGRAHNLMMGTPEGWTTEGDLDRGFVDWCRECSQ